MSGSSYWPMSAVYVHGTAPFSRIHATATEVSRPPEKAMPTRSPTGRDVRTLDTAGQPTAPPGGVVPVPTGWLGAPVDAVAHDVDPEPSGCGGDGGTAWTGTA